MLPASAAAAMFALVACLFAAGFSVASADVVIDGGDGAGGWDEGAWRVQVDGVMGGKSSGNLQFQSGTMIFSGAISLDGGGFSSVRRGLPSQDLSSFAGLVVELEAAAFSSNQAPLGLHLQLNDRSMWGYAAAFAVPFAEASGTTASVFLPMSAFDRASWMGSTCGTCRLDATAVRGMDVYVLFQDGPFEVRLRSITAVQEVQAYTVPVVSLSSAASITDLLVATIRSGGSLYDQGYRGLCVAIYTSSLNTVLAATGSAEAVKGVACAGLRRSLQELSGKADRAWALRDTMDAILADLGGVARGSRQAWLPDGATAESSLDECRGLLESGASGVDSAIVDASAVGSTSVGSEQVSSSGASMTAIEGFEGPFSGMGISGYNDLQSSMARDPADCAARCRADTRCRSFDWGAREAVQGECWLSTADRDSAGAAYKAWPLYDYYERIDDEASPEQQQEQQQEEQQMTAAENSTTTAESTTMTFTSAAAPPRRPAAAAPAAAAYLAVAAAAAALAAAAAAPL